MDNETKAKIGMFTKLNNKLSYILGNIFKLFWNIVWFCVRISGVLLLASPFVLFGIAIASPSYAIEILGAIQKYLEIIVGVFK